MQYWSNNIAVRLNYSNSSVTTVVCLSSPRLGVVWVGGGGGVVHTENTTPATVMVPSKVKEKLMFWPPESFLKYISVPKSYYSLSRVSFIEPRSTTNIEARAIFVCYYTSIKVPNQFLVNCRLLLQTTSESKHRRFI